MRIQVMQPDSEDIDVLMVLQYKASYQEENDGFNVRQSAAVLLGRLDCGHSGSLHHWGLWGHRTLLTP